MPTKRIRTGQGRVEYLAHKQSITEQLTQGYTLTSIYEKLKKEGKLSMSYSTLSGLISGRPKKKKEKKIEKEEIISPVVVPQIQPCTTENIDNAEHQPKIISSEKPGFGKRDKDGFDFEEHV